MGTGSDFPANPFYLCTPVTHERRRVAVQRQGVESLKAV